MSEWAYRQCSCGNRVHINFTCSCCNGDPWNVRKGIQDIIDKKSKHINSLKKQIETVRQDIINLEKRLERTYKKLDLDENAKEI